MRYKLPWYAVTHQMMSDGTNPDTDTPTCQYVGNERAGIDTEKESNGWILCTGKPSTTLKPDIDLPEPVGNLAVCGPHKCHLMSENNPYDWKVVDAAERAQRAWEGQDE